METIPVEVAAEVLGVAIMEEIVVAGDSVVILNNKQGRTVTMVVDTDKVIVVLIVVIQVAIPPQALITDLLNNLVRLLPLGQVIQPRL